MSIITRSEGDCQKNHWKKSLGEGFTDSRSLLKFLDLASHHDAYFKAEQLFSLRVPRAFANRMKKGDIKDPLLLQVLPLAQEFSQSPGYVLDPLAEQGAGQPGLLHKYKTRVLLVLTGACAVNCRYCFRRHFPYQDHIKAPNKMESWLQYIERHPDVNEVILSGGDPLLINDEYLSRLVDAIEALPQVKRIRIHTRLPVVLPERIDETLLSWCHSRPGLKLIMVTHINHAQEIDTAVASAMAQLQAQQVQTLNQAVLLNGINDDAQALADLSEKLYDINVLPYYLHALDKTAGTHHFDVDAKRALTIYQELLALLPGYLVPKFVRELPNTPSKLPVQMLDDH